MINIASLAAAAARSKGLIPDTESESDSQSTEDIVEPHHDSLDVDVIVISAGHSAYKSPKAMINLLERTSIKIYDTIGLFSNEQISLLQEKHKVSVLGRGDL